MSDNAFAVLLIAVCVTVLLGLGAAWAWPRFQQRRYRRGYRDRVETAADEWQKPLIIVLVSVLAALLLGVLIAWAANGGQTADVTITVRQGTIERTTTVLTRTRTVVHTRTRIKRVVVVKHKRKKH